MRVNYSRKIFCPARNNVKKNKKHLFIKCAKRQVARLNLLFGNAIPVSLLAPHVSSLTSIKKRRRKIDGHVVQHSCLSCNLSRWDESAFCLQISFCLSCGYAPVFFFASSSSNILASVTHPSLRLSKPLSPSPTCSSSPSLSRFRVAAPTTPSPFWLILSLAILTTSSTALVLESPRRFCFSSLINK